MLASLLELLPDGVSRKRISTCSLKEAYVGKMVKVNEAGDRWSLISLGHGSNVELKFVDTMRRQFEFSVDSFQVSYQLTYMLSFFSIILFESRLLSLRNSNPRVYEKWGNTVRCNKIDAISF